MRVHVALDGVLIDEMGSIALLIEMTKWFELFVVVICLKENIYISNCLQSVLITLESMELCTLRAVPHS